MTLAAIEGVEVTIVAFAVLVVAIVLVVLAVNELLTERDGDRLLEPRHPAVPKLSKALVFASAVAFLAGAAGLEVAGVNVLVAVFPGLAALAWVNAIDAELYRGERRVAVGLVLFGLGWIAYALAPLGVPSLIGSVCVAAGGGLAVTAARGRAERRQANGAGVQ